MKRIKTTRYDVAEHLRTPEEMAAYLEACFEEAGGDAAFIAKALGDIARAKGMAQVARDAGLSRESLYKALAKASSLAMTCTFFDAPCLTGISPRIVPASMAFALL